MKKSMILIIAIGVCICFIAAMAVIFSTRQPPALDAEAVQHTFIFAPSNYHPEPQERMQYILDTLAMPFLCALLYFVLSRLFNRLRLQKFGKIYWLLSLEVIVIAILYLFILAYSARLGFAYLQSNLLAQNPLLALALGAIILTAWFLLHRGREKTSKISKFLEPLAFTLGGILILLVASVAVFNEADAYVPGVHFVAYFDSVVQVFLGKALLVDISPQYGLYALLLKPLFKIIGLSVLKFTLLMAVLKVLAFLSIFLLLWKAARSKLIAFLGFAAILFFTCILGGVDIGVDPFFQYIPHRLIFPAIFAFLLWLFIVETRPGVRKGLYWSLSVLCALAVLWNNDTGLIVLITWLVYVLFEEALTFRAQKPVKFLLNCLRHLAIILGCTLAAVAVFVLYTYLASGQWPSLAGMTLYTKLFYFYGFFMLPMRPIHPWNLVVLGYILGLFLPISFLLDRNGYTLAHISRDPKDHAFYKITFALSVLGIGLLNYFVGRSHDWNLLPVSWVALALFTLFADRLLAGLSRILHTRAIPWKTKARLLLRHNDKVFFFLILFFFLSSSALSVFPNLPVYETPARARLSAVAAGTPPFLSEQLQFIDSTSQANDPVFILSDYAPELYLYTRHARPLAIPGFGELVLQEEVRQVKAFLAEPPENARIYWAPGFTGFSTFTGLDLRTYSNLTQVASSEDGGLILFESAGR